MKSLNGAAVVAAWSAALLCEMAGGQEVVCWGRQGSGFCPTPQVTSPVRWIFGAAGRTQLLTSEGLVIETGSYPGAPAAALPILQMAIDNSTLLLTDDHQVVAWGLDNAGQVSEIPADLASVARVACGAYSNGVVLLDGTVRVWGQSHLEAVPTDLSDVRSLHLGHDAAFAVLTDGSVRAWGANAFGALEIPADLPQVRTLDVGDWHVIALLEDGTVRCWGDNRKGQCDVPAGLAGVVEVQAAGGWSDSGQCVALLADGTLVQWGSNSYGEANIPIGVTLRYVYAGHRHIVAITGTPDCNGDGIYDTHQLIAGELLDLNTNGVPDCCDEGVSCDPCVGDVNNDGQVNGADISVLLGFWGLNGKPVAADINKDGSVDGADLAQLLGSWGECK